MRAVSVCFGQQGLSVFSAGVGDLAFSCRSCLFSSSRVTFDLMKLDEPRAFRFREPAHRDVQSQGQYVRSRRDRVEWHLGAKVRPRRVSGRRVVRDAAHGQGMDYALYVWTRHGVSVSSFGLFSAVCGYKDVSSCISCCFVSVDIGVHIYFGVWVYILII